LSIEEYEICYNCDHLVTPGIYFQCRKSSSFYFLPLERACGECKDYKKTRSLSQKHIDIWRLLVALDVPIAIHSLPKKYLGCIGLLVRYKLVEIYTGKAFTVSVSDPLKIFAKEKFIDLIRTPEGRLLE